MTEETASRPPSTDDIVKILRTVLDPELYIDVWTLGLIYDIELDGRVLRIRMTFTSAGCPVGPLLIEEIKAKTEALDGIDSTEVVVVFDPPWEPPEDLKAMLGLF